MKNFKKMMALVIAMVMVLAMALPAMAEGGTDPEPQTTVTPATGDGSITIKSPVLGTSYDGYRIFDMTMDDAENPTSFAYTISTTSPFWDAVLKYAAMPTEEGATDANADGLTLTQSATDATIYNVTVDKEKFDAQAFGQAMEAAVKGDAEATPPVDPINAASVKYAPTYEANKDVVTIATSDEIKFENLPFGYYLIIGNYPPAATGTISVGDTSEEGLAANKGFVLTDDDLEDDALIETKVNAYVEATVTSDYIATKIAEGNAKNKYGDTLTSADEPEYTQFVEDLKASLKEDTLKRIAAAKAEYTANKYDINVQSQRLVFLDSTTPDVEIIEKNETDKWDIPVNPDGHATAEGLPEHGEPDGGKNVIVGYMTNEETDEEEPVYADWTEANIGDKITYEISINAMNFVRTKDYPDNSGNALANEDSSTNKGDVKQVKEYIIGDYQNDALTFDSTGHVANDFDATKGDYIKVSIVDDDGNVVKINNVDQVFDYTTWSKYFFIPEGDVKDGPNSVNSILSEGGGIPIAWVGTTDDPEIAKAHKNYTVNEEPVWVKAAEGEDADADGNKLVDGQKVPVMIDLIGEDGQVVTEIVKDTEGNIIYEYVSPDGNTVSETAVDGYTRRAKTQPVKVQQTVKHYIYSIYDSDVTIKVQYTMTLTDKATIDAPGNINYSEYGMNFVDNEDYEYTAPNPGDTNPDKPGKPDQEREVDTATVYTYALAIQKVDEKGDELAGATFKIKGLTVKKISDGYYKVESYDSTSTADSEELIADKNGLLIIEGLKASEKLTVTEAQAPDGYNLLTKSEEMQATKVGTEVTTTSETTYYSDDKMTTPSSKEDYTTRKTVYYAADGTSVRAVKVDCTDGETRYYSDIQLKSEISADEFNALVIATTEKVAKSDVESEVEPYAIKVENKKGTELPSTGGMGTTIFYVIGAILVIGAGIMLVTRRRMNAN